MRIALLTMFLTSKMICHKDRLSFRVYGEKINLGNFRPFFDARRTKSPTLTTFNHYI
jgi:hypothetical protein